MKKRSTDREKRTTLGRGLYWGILIFLYLLSKIIIHLCDWYHLRFDVSFEEILFTITSPLAGSDVSFMTEAAEYIFPKLYQPLGNMVFIVLMVVFLHTITICFEIKIRNKFLLKLDIYRVISVLFGVVTIWMCINSVSYAYETLGVGEYVAHKRDKTTIYEDYYIDPNEVSITGGEQARNLIYIYLESMETTYASYEVGGQNTINYIPRLTALARDNISFSDSEKILGGANLTAGSGYTMGALLSTTSGVPFSIPVEGNSMDTFKNFLPGITSLGDILEREGYSQVFLCGSDGEFAGRNTYFQQHGNYDVIDYYDAQEKNYIPEDYRVWWGYEDAKLYDIAKTELTSLANQNEPFNFTMLTVDTHHVDGYVCERCPETYSEKLGNVLECADIQISEFLAWCKEQDFYENTTIVITGDHFRMDTSLIPDNAERRLYNCFINSAAEIQGETQNRTYTSLDLFPTTLAAMGFRIEGERLGLGTNLFSSQKTLSEELGFDTVNTELSKYSKFYAKHFY